MHRHTANAVAYYEGCEMKKEDLIYLAGLAVFISIGILLVVLVATNADNQANNIDTKKEWNSYTPGPKT